MKILYEEEKNLREKFKIKKMLDKTYEDLEKLIIKKNFRDSQKILISEPVYDMLNI